jgi:hypothetical protein
VALSVAAGGDNAVMLPMPPTAGQWTDLDMPVTLAAGGNRVLIEGHEKEWNSVQIDHIEVLAR